MLSSVAGGGGELIPGFEQFAVSSVAGGGAGNEAALRHQGHRCGAGAVPDWQHRAMAPPRAAACPRQRTADAQVVRIVIFGTMDLRATSGAGRTP